MTDIIKGAIQLLRSHNCPVLDPFPIFEKETDPPPTPPHAPSWIRIGKKRYDRQNNSNWV